MIKTYDIEMPRIPSAGIYYFTTDSGVIYEVRFGRKKDNILHTNIVFGVINEEYDGEEYVTTNKGEMYNVMATMIKIVEIFKQAHPNINLYEFVGETEEGDDENKPSTRTRLYHRYTNRVFAGDWKIELEGNKVTITK